jgi:hypothetical protein
MAKIQRARGFELEGIATFGGLVAVFFFIFDVEAAIIFTWAVGTAFSSCAAAFLPLGRNPGRDGPLLPPTPGIYDTRP